ncbi:PLP-dependent aminotransferase family protein, partial [Rhizobium johnstonii]
RGLVPSQERIFVTPGAHTALLAIFGLLAKPGETVLSEIITYPGMRSIAAQLRLNLAGLPMDEDGILPDAFAEACERLKPKELYLNPTLQNP